MSSIITLIPAYLSKVCANRPIHVIIFVGLLSSFAYLSILDYYASTNVQFSNKSVSFYHPPGSPDYESWTKIDDYTQYPHADHYALKPIKFKGTGDAQIPEVDAFYFGAGENDRNLLAKYSEINTISSSLKYISGEDGTEWKARHSHRVGRYFEYFKGLFFRTKSLIQGAEPFDIILVAVAYGAMWFTFIQLFIEMKKQGSSFWLAFGSILSSGSAFLFALAFTTQVSNIRVPFVSLTEGLPFLVSTIGFKHKVEFTAPVLQAIRSNKDQDVAITISEVVRKQTGLPLIRDHIVIAASFFICTILAPNLTGLCNFCYLSIAILVCDLLFTFTFYAAVLSLKAQINKVHQTLALKEALEEDGISATVAESVATSTESKDLIFNHNTSVISFKVAVVAGFLGFHLFALGTSWLYDSSSDEPITLISTTANSLSKSAAKNIPIGTWGTVVTILPTTVYSPINVLLKFEDLVLDLVSTISLLIRDSLISKFLFVFAGISMSVNVYLLNAARHVTASSVVVGDKKIKSLQPISSSYEKKSKSSSGRKRGKSSSSSTDFALPVSAPISSSINGGDAVKEAQIVEESSSDNDQSSALESDSQSSEGRIISVRPVDELVEIMKAGNVKDCNNEEVVTLVTEGKLPLYALEKQLGDKTRAVAVRRSAIANLADAPVLNSSKLPYKHYDYDRVFGACCENVIGYMPIPVGVAGPLIIDGVPYHIPMATTEGCLVASTMRGCKAINAGSGVQTVLTNDGMTRGPCVRFESLARAGAAKIWLDSEEGQRVMKKAFNSTSRFARLQHLKTAMAGTLLYIRFKTTTGDAMGMNMISKGVEYSLNYMVTECGFEDMEIISVSGNYCIDKKPAAINWIEGRGKSVVCEARIPADVVRKVLKSDVDALIELNISKNLVGSALAGAMGGFNAQAANLVTAIYIATGQDPAQNVESSNCMTLMNKAPNGDLVISVSMPCIEVGTIGGGTVLEPQGAMLELLGVRGPHPTEPGSNARQLAKIVASAVLAAELSLCSALAAGHLVQSHMILNRSSNKGPDATATPAPITTSGTTQSSAPAVSKQDTSKLSPAELKRLEEGSKICISS